MWTAQRARLRARERCGAFGASAARGGPRRRLPARNCRRLGHHGREPCGSRPRPARQYASDRRDAGCPDSDLRPRFRRAYESRGKPCLRAPPRPAVARLWQLRRRAARGRSCRRLGGAPDVRSPLLQISTHVRTGSAQWLSEGVATFGLVLTIFGCVARVPTAAPHAVGPYITAAYWFTAS